MAKTVPQNCSYNKQTQHHLFSLFRSFFHFMLASHFYMLNNSLLIGHKSCLIFKTLVTSLDLCLLHKFLKHMLQNDHIFQHTEKLKSCSMTMFTSTIGMCLLKPAVLLNSFEILVFKLKHHCSF